MAYGRHLRGKEDSERATEAPNPEVGGYYIEAMETTRNGSNFAAGVPGH
jgi:hypothetical protein